MTRVADVSRRDEGWRYPARIVQLDANRMTAGEWQLIGHFDTEKAKAAADAVLETGETT